MAYEDLNDAEKLVLEKIGTMLNDTSPGYIRYCAAIDLERIVLANEAIVQRLNEKGHDIIPLLIEFVSNDKYDIDKDGIRDTSSESEHRKNMVMRIFSESNDSRTIGPLRKFLETASMESCRATAVCSLYWLGDKETMQNEISAQVSLLDDSDMQIRYKAASTLMWIVLLDKDAFLEAATALKSKVDIVDPLIAALKDDYEWVISDVAAVLGAIGGGRAVQALNEAVVRCKKPLVRAEIYSAFGAIAEGGYDLKGNECISGMIGDLFQKEHGYLGVSNFLIIEALGDIGDERANEPLLRLKRDENAELRRLKSCCRKYDEQVSALTALEHALEAIRIGKPLNSKKPTKTAQAQRRAAQEKDNLIQKEKIVMEMAKNSSQPKKETPLYNRIFCPARR